MREECPGNPASTQPARNNFLYKLILAGDGGVGKTSLALRATLGTFHELAKVTIGVDVHVKRLSAGGQRATLQVWDFGGEERFRFLLPRYARQADGALFLYDVTNLASLLHLGTWMEVLRAGNPDVPVLCVGTKVDLVDQRKVSPAEAERLARDACLAGVAEVSSKTGWGVDPLFTTITRLIAGRRLAKSP